MLGPASARPAGGSERRGLPVLRRERCHGRQPARRLRHWQCGGVPHREYDECTLRSWSEHRGTQYCAVPQYM